MVTLAGTVDSPAAKTRAVELANTTNGVKSVIDELRIPEPAAATSGVEIVDVATDGGVTTAVKTKFLADPSIAGLKIDVDTKNHVVTLTGVVPTEADKTHTVEVARKPLPNHVAPRKRETVGEIKAKVKAGHEASG